MQIKCPVCGSTRMASGRIENMDHAHFVPRDAKGLASVSKVKLEAAACGDCGVITWSVEPEELQAKANLPKAE